MSKKLVEERRYCDVGNCALVDMLEEIKRLIEKYGEDARIEFDSGYSNLDQEVIFMREETDKEYENRLKQEAKEEEKRQKDLLLKENKERKEFERLKKKFKE